MDKPYLFIDSSVDGHLGCLQFLAVTNNVAVNICAQLFMWTCVFSSESPWQQIGVIITNVLGKTAERLSNLFETEKLLVIQFDYD